MTMFIYGILVGIGGTMLILELRATITRYKDRQQAEFEAAVAAATAHRRAEQQRRSNEWSNVRTFAFDDDPFADV